MRGDDSMDAFYYIINKVAFRRWPKRDWGYLDSEEYDQFDDEYSSKIPPTRFSTKPPDLGSLENCRTRLRTDQDVGWDILKLSGTIQRLTWEKEKQLQRAISLHERRIWVKVMNQEAYKEHIEMAFNMAHNLEMAELQAKKDLEKYKEGVKSEKKWRDWGW
jgi:hypothetical protein